MTISLKHMGRRTGAVLVSLLLLLTLAVSASAAAVKMTVGVRFWRESGDKESMADSAVDTAREATLTRQPNGTFTLELPVKQLSSMNMTGRLTGIAIGEGRTPQEVIADMGGVVEGYYAAVSAKELADSLGVEMPICEAMYDILYNGAEVRGMVHRLMSRAPKRETDNGWV